MQAFLLDFAHSSTTFHSETDAGAIFLPELRLDIFISDSIRHEAIIFTINEG